MRTPENLRAGPAEAKFRARRRRRRQPDWMRDAMTGSHWRAPT